PRRWSLPRAGGTGSGQSLLKPDLPRHSIQTQTDGLGLDPDAAKGGRSAFACPTGSEHDLDQRGHLNRKLRFCIFRQCNPPIQGPCCYTSSMKYMPFGTTCRKGNSEICAKVSLSMSSPCARRSSTISVILRVFQYRIALETRLKQLALFMISS